MFINKQKHNEKVLKILNYKQVPTTNLWVHPTKDFIWELKDGSMTYLPLRLSLGGYLYTETYINNKNRYIRLHTLKGLAFIPLGPYEEIVGKYDFIYELAQKGVIINHTDGIKTNNDINNLEWSTYSENNTHAHKTGLRTDTIGIFVFNILTKKEKYYYSISEAVRELGYAKNTIRKYLLSDRDTLFAFKYLIRKAIEDDYPVYVSRDDIWKSNHGTHGLNAVGLLNKRSGTVEYFYTKKLAIAAYYLPTIFNRKFVDKNDFIENYMFKMFPVVDYDILVTLANEYKDLDNFYNGGKSGQRKLPFKVTDNEGNEMIYENIDVAAKALGTTVEGLKTGVNKTKGKGKWKGYRIEFIK